MYVLIFILFVSLVCLVLYTWEIKERNFALKREIDQLTPKVFKYAHEAEQYKTDFQESQDKLVSVQTAFMEYKKSKGEFNEQEFLVYL